MTTSPPFQLLSGVVLVAFGALGRPLFRVFLEGIDDSLSGGRTLRPGDRRESDQQHARARLDLVSLLLVVCGLLAAGVGLFHLIF